MNNNLLQETVRIVHESASVPNNKTTPVGLGTSFSMFCQMLYNSQIKENTVLMSGPVGWRVGPIDNLSAFGMLYGKRAVVTLIGLGNTKNIVSLKIGNTVGVITGNNIVVTVPSGTDITSLTPSIDHRGKMISPTIAQDFTIPKVYTVTAENLSTQIYNVSVGVAP